MLAGYRNAWSRHGRTGRGMGRTLGLVATQVAAVPVTVASASLRHVDVAVAAVVVVNAVVANPGRVVAGSAGGGVAGGVLSVTRVVGMKPVDEGAGAGRGMEAAKGMDNGVQFMATMNSVDGPVAAWSTASATVGCLFLGKKPNRRCGEDETSWTDDPRVFCIHSSVTLRTCRSVASKTETVGRGGGGCRDDGRTSCRRSGWQLVGSGRSGGGYHRARRR